MTLSYAEHPPRFSPANSHFQLPSTIARPVAPPSTGDLLVADDATLALALQAGNRHAARVVWDRFAPTVSRILRRTLGPRFDVEDIQQDIFLAFFRKVPELRNPDALKAFLMSITVRTIKHQLRCARSRRLTASWDDTTNVGDPAAEVAVDIGTRETLKAFYGVLDTLKPLDRTLFGLRYLEGMNVTDVASTFGMSLSTAKRNLARIWKLVTLRVRKAPALSPDP